MLSRSIYVAALVAFVVVSGKPPKQLIRISNEQAEADAKALGNTMVGSQTQSQNRFDAFTAENSASGPYVMPTDLGSSFDQLIVRMRPRTCRNQDRTDQPMIHCPTPDSSLVDWKCIRFTDLCNGVPDCPNKEDEHPTFCMFHELQNSEVNKLRQIISNLLDNEKDHKAVEKTETKRWN